jgi:membrane protease YdiL (CAAX protease family)
VRSCTSCGAASPLAATWCSQCFLSFAAPAPVFAAAGPVTFAPAVAVPGGPSYDEPSGRMVSRRAFLLTVVAIGVGALAMLASYGLSRSPLDEATYIRYAAVLTMAVYAVVGLLVVTQITPSVRLRWSVGSPATGIAIGLTVGAALSGLLLAAVSAAAGHLSPDPRMVTMMSEGDVPHIAATMLIGCIAAPLIEEVLFRGLFLESLRGKGAAVAIWLSAAAFAVWHLNLVALRYYALLGALLGWLYVRRGLVCSIATHLAFNGVLAVAAVTVVLGGGGTVSGDGLTMTLPNGWHSSPAALPATVLGGHPALMVRGPSGATIAVIAYDTPVAPDISKLADLIRDPRFAASNPGLQPLTLREVTVPAGRLVEVDATHDGDRRTVAFLCRAGTTYELVLRASGSPKARADFEPILRSLAVA